METELSTSVVLQTFEGALGFDRNFMQCQSESAYSK